MVENIWQLDQQIKQVFDVDAYNNGIDTNDIKSKISPNQSPKKEAIKKQNNNSLKRKKFFQTYWIDGSQKKRRSTPASLRKYMYIITNGYETTTVRKSEVFFFDLCVTPR